METDEELIGAYFAGDDNAFEVLYRRYFPMLYGLFRSRRLQGTDAEDLAEDVAEQLGVHDVQNNLRVQRSGPVSKDQGSQGQGSQGQGSQGQGAGQTTAGQGTGLSGSSDRQKHN